MLNPAKKWDFENEEVEWKVDEISVYGTVTHPKGEGPFATVVFVAGSGPTDRDWCSPLLPGTNGSAKLLAELLASQGFLTLRYDKRASGPHVRENIPKMIGKISMQSHLDELSGAVKTLIERKDVDPKELFALTNSEGAIHALNYQLQEKPKFKGLILTGAPGRAIGQVARTQILNQFKSLPNAEVIMKLYDNLIAIFLKGIPIVPDSSLPDGIQQLLLSLSTPMNLPFSRELWNYNPSEYIAKVEEPTLVLIGKKDVQVDWQEDGKALENASAIRNAVSFVYPENANHVLKHEERPREKLTSETVLQYNQQNRILDQEASNKILEWLTNATNKNPKA
jgi:uncharacterized protein